MVRLATRSVAEPVPAHECATLTRCCRQDVGSDPARAAGARALLEVAHAPEDAGVLAEEGALLSLTDLAAPARQNGLLVLRTGARSVMQPLGRAAAASDACAAPPSRPCAPWEALHVYNPKTPKP